MNNAHALKALNDYYEISNPTDDDEFLFVEALDYLIKETKDPKYMTELGWHYSSKKRFDLEIKYLEMAAEYGYGPAYEELGYMWYYGQHREKDYRKAFDCYSRGARKDKYGNAGSLWCKYKLADMYRFGYFVEKDEDKYREMIEEAYEEVKNPKYLNDPYPEICYRLADIRTNEGKKDEAVKLLKSAKGFMAERLSRDAFWGHIKVMGRIIQALYGLIPFSKDNFDFYDMFYLAKDPGEYKFKHNGRNYQIEVSDDEDRAIGFNGKWFRSFEKFCVNAEFEKEKFTTLYDEFYDWEAEV